VSKGKDLGKGDEIYEVARLYAKGKSFTDIKTELGLHQEKVKRDVRKALSSFIEYENRAREETEETSELTESMNRD
jgi:hypothetical protein